MCLFCFFLYTLLFLLHAVSIRQIHFFFAYFLYLFFLFRFSIPFSSILIVDLNVSFILFYPFRVRDSFLLCNRRCCCSICFNPLKLFNSSVSLYFIILLVLLLLLLFIWFDLSISFRSFDVMFSHFFVIIIVVG